MRFILAAVICLLMSCESSNHHYAPSDELLAELERGTQQTLVEMGISMAQGAELKHQRLALRNLAAHALDDGILIDLIRSADIPSSRLQEDALFLRHKLKRRHEGKQLPPMMAYLAAKEQPLSTEQAVLLRSFCRQLAVSQLLPSPLWWQEYEK